VNKSDLLTVLLLVLGLALFGVLTLPLWGLTRRAALMDVWRTLACVATITVLVSLGCARQTTPVAPGPPTAPRASWSIRSGPQGGGESEVCRSDRQQTCVLEASNESQPMAVTVSVYLYPAGAPTKYSGAFQSTFIQTAGAGGYEAKVDYSVAPGELPAAVAAGGRVTSVPGDHAFRMALLGEVPSRMDPHQFEQTVPVRVVPPGTMQAP
jgi:hypothetical protein